MKGFKVAIESDATENTDFRRVLYTSEHSQLVLMSLRPDEEIGVETHEVTINFFASKKDTENASLTEMSMNSGTATRLSFLAEHGTTSSISPRSTR